MKLMLENCWCCFSILYKCTKKEMSVAQLFQVTTKFMSLLPHIHTCKHMLRLRSKSLCNGPACSPTMADNASFSLYLFQLLLSVTLSPLWAFRTPDTFWFLQNFSSATESLSLRTHFYCWLARTSVSYFPINLNQCFPERPTLLTWRWRQHVSPKRPQSYMFFFVKNQQFLMFS
jgi:hypothetical protein